jgi:hypothetical protein
MYFFKFLSQIILFLDLFHPSTVFLTLINRAKISSKQTNLISSDYIKNNTFVSNNRTMAASATLPAVSLTTANNSSIDSSKRKSEEKINLSIGKTSTQRRIPSPKQSANETDNSLTGSIPIFRIPKIGR